MAGVSVYLATQVSCVSLTSMNASQVPVSVELHVSILLIITAASVLQHTPDVNANNVCISFITIL